MKKIKVLHINDAYEGGGAESVFRDTLRASEALGYETRMLHSDGKTNPLSYLYSTKYVRETEKAIAEFSPDIVHLHNYYHYLTPSVLHALRKMKKKYAFKVVFTAHDYHLICPNSGFQYFSGKARNNFDPSHNNLSYFRRFDHRSVVHSLLKCTQHFLNYRVLKLSNTIDLIISPGEFLSGVFGTWGIQQPIEIIRNPVELLPTIADAAPTETEAGGTIELVFIGRLSSEKGLVEFVEKLNSATRQKINLNIYGQGESEQQLRAMPLRNGLSLAFHGFRPREEVITHLHRYDIFVLPSVWFENAPISIVEAASAGLPVLVPNYGGLKEMAELTHYPVEFDYQRNDLCEKVDQAFSHRKLNALRDASLFSFETYKARLNMVYQRLTRNNPQES